ncbi:MAG: YgiQ family radical SAM protein, partial [Deltaproteobacteria bacterium]
FISRELKINPEQVQIFTPTPSTWSTLMYCTGMIPGSGTPLFVEKDRAAKDRQKKVLTGKDRNLEKTSRLAHRQKTIGRK